MGTEGSIPWTSNFDNVDVGEAKEHCGPDRGHQREAVCPVNGWIVLVS